MFARSVVGSRHAGHSELTVVSFNRSFGMAASTLVVALGTLVAVAYGLLAGDAYRGLPESTVLAAQGQDVCSAAVAVILVILVRRRVLGARAYVTWLALLAYILYSYAIYLIGVPMNRVFLVYVVIESVAGAALLPGILRLSRATWRSAASPRLRRGTGWMLLAVAVMFAGLWLSAVLPYALGGGRPEPEGVGGTPYPVFVLDLVVVLPCIAAIGVLLLRDRLLGAPLAVVALLKILTLFTALWAGVLAVVISDLPLALGPDAVPSLVLLGASLWLSYRWLRVLAPSAIDRVDRNRDMPDRPQERDFRPVSESG